MPFRIRNDSSGTGQTVAMFTIRMDQVLLVELGVAQELNLSPAVSTTVDDNTLQELIT